MTIIDFSNLVFSHIVGMLCLPLAYGLFNLFLGRYYASCVAEVLAYFFCYLVSVYLSYCLISNTAILDLLLIISFTISVVLYIFSYVYSLYYSNTDRFEIKVIKPRAALVGTRRRDRKYYIRRQNENIFATPFTVTILNPKIRLQQLYVKGNQVSIQLTNLIYKYRDLSYMIGDEIKVPDYHEHVDVLSAAFRAHNKIQKDYAAEIVGLEHFLEKYPNSLIQQLANAKVPLSLYLSVVKCSYLYFTALPVDISISSRIWESLIDNSGGKLLNLSSSRKAKMGLDVESVQDLPKDHSIIESVIAEEATALLIIQTDKTLLSGKYYKVFEDPRFKYDLEILQKVKTFSRT